jgi:haloalkane dehalogenase
VILFGAACRLPVIRSFIASPAGLRFAMRIGVNDPACLTDEVMRAVLAPFESAAARRALLKAGSGLHPKGFEEIAARLSSFRVPVRIVYGKRDRILPDVGKTMCRVAGDLPQAEVTALPDCGHFLQEDRPDEVGRLLADFFA